MGLSFRVRYGTGRFPHAMTAVTITKHTNQTLVTCYSVLVIKSHIFFGSRLLSRNRIVNANSIEIISSNIVILCVESHRPISTGQLHKSLVLASTSCLSTQWSSWGPLTLKVHGNLISKQASRLDAFSGYPFPT